MQVTFWAKMTLRLGLVWETGLSTFRSTTEGCVLLGVDLAAIKGDRRSKSRGAASLIFFCLLSRAKRSGPL